MMYSELYRYLIRYNELPIPGVGTFSISRIPAVIDFTAKKIHAPVYGVNFHPDSYLPGRHFFNWLSEERKISDREAIFLFNDFAFDMKQNLEKGARISWKGVGEIKKSKQGDITLDPDKLVQEESIPAEKIMRLNYEHMVRVGEDQKTSGEMTELLSRSETKKNTWWIWAIAVGIIALMFIGWYLSEHGLEGNSISNSRQFIPDETPAVNYKPLQ